MAGIYLHIPFCKSRCAYCAFYSTTALERRQRYVDTLCQEMALRRSPDTVATIYLGGGTPSQLTLAQLKQLFDHLYIYNKVEPNAEVTIECNPDDVTEAFASFLPTVPVNRVSMGAQTFDDERLRFINRRHSASQVSQAVRRLRRVGIGNISLDMIYGFPGETMGDWQADLAQVLSLEPEHLSAYCLSLEERTPLHEKMLRGELKECDEETERQMYEMLMDQLNSAGYEHYEVSNFARPGYRSRHNSSYWTGIPYIGLGAAAHSYDGKCRQWNVSHLEEYMKGIEAGHPIIEREELDTDTRYNDTVMLSLRTCEGLHLDLLSETDREFCLKLAKPFISQGLLTSEGSHLRLTRQGIFVSDMIMSELMRV